MYLSSLTGRGQRRVRLGDRDAGDGHLAHQAVQGRRRQPMPHPHTLTAGMVIWKLHAYE